MDIKQKMFNIIRLLEHHPEHHIKLKIMGETFKPCSRCLGQYIIGIPFYMIFAVLYLTGYTLSFTTVFTLSWVLAGLTLLDWGSVEILHIRQGNNTTRLITGGTLGIGISMYFWMLPTSWMFKLGTLTIYFLTISLITFATNCKKQGINPLAEINKGIDNIWSLLAHPKRFWVACTCCPCCSTGCCCGTTSCCPMVLCLFACCIPCLCFPMLCGSGKGGSCNSCSTCGSCDMLGGKKKT